MSAASSYTCLQKRIKLPDEVRIAQCRAAPQLGPKILFFSGGSALKPLSRSLISYTYNSCHIVTPFDSGGSSAKLREAFQMPAVGDIRNRLMALADQSITGNPEIYSLFAHRLPAKAKRQDLIRELHEMARGRHQLVAKVPEAMRGIIRHHLQYFLKHMPPEFDPQGASIGNLILAAGYLEQERNLDPVIYIYSKLAEVRGGVRPVVNQNLHLFARLEDGQLLKGQHLLTGKHAPPISSPVQEVYLCHHSGQPAPAKITDNIKKLITAADLICYPMGSFYSSLIANLLPQGIGSAVASTSCPKVYIPNPYSDPESYGLDLNQQILTLLAYLQKDQDLPANQQPFLDYILLDEDPDLYPGSLDIDLLQELNIEVLRCRLVTADSAPRIEPSSLLQILLSLT